MVLVSTYEILIGYDYVRTLQINIFPANELGSF
jgi:hypothetical protein